MTLCFYIDFIQEYIFFPIFRQRSRRIVTFDSTNFQKMKRYCYSLVILLVIYSSSLFAQQHMQTEILGNAESVTQQNNVLLIKTKEAEARIWLYSSTIIRVSISKEHSADSSFAVVKDPESTLNYKETATDITLSTSALTLHINKSPLRFNFSTADGKVLSEDDPRFGTNWQGTRVVNYRKLYKDERFIGLGEKTGNLDRRGSSYVNWNTDCLLHTLRRCALLIIPPSMYHAPFTTTC